jgi:hypothetical protein
MGINPEFDPPENEIEEPLRYGRDSPVIGCDE